MTLSLPLQLSYNDLWTIHWSELPLEAAGAIALVVMAAVFIVGVPLITLKLFDIFNINKRHAHERRVRFTLQLGPDYDGESGFLLHRERFNRLRAAGNLRKWAVLAYEPEAYERELAAQLRLKLRTGSAASVDSLTRSLNRGLRAEIEAANLAIRIVLGRYERVGMGLREGAGDLYVFQTYYKAAVREDFEACREWIRYVRQATASKTLYREFEWLAGRMGR